MSTFFQMAPLGSLKVSDDELWCSYLRRFFSPSEYNRVLHELSAFEERLELTASPLAEQAEENPPRHIPFDAFGNRIDEVRMSSAWRGLANFSAQEGLVAEAYERPWGARSRLMQMMKIALFHPFSAYFTCPLAMSDGAARLIEVHGDEYLKKNAFRRLISRDPEQAWTSGQWMTEKIGGSDISQSETKAVWQNGQWRLYGVKWFTSSVSSEMAITLARIEKDGKVQEGSQGLGLFYVKLRDLEQRLDGIEVLRLKDKLGTKALPTAELSLKGTPAYLIAPQGKAVKTMAALLNVTRVYNSCTSLGAYRELLSRAKDYAEKRSAFGSPLSAKPLHVRTLSEMEVDYQALFHLCFLLARLQGQIESPEGEGSPPMDAEVVQRSYEQAESLFRLLTPVVKLMSAKINMRNTSELLESFGGVAYIEDSGIPRFLRDAQVLSIWEGTTNVLSLDVLRVVMSEGGLRAFMDEISARIKAVRSPHFSEERMKLEQVLTEMNLFLAELPNLSAEERESCARDLAWSLGQTMAALCLIEHAEISKNRRFQFVARNYCHRALWLVRESYEPSRDREIVFGADS